jgi:1,4-dihydroxy-2-naphthoate octaprenyltransferase
MITGIWWSLGVGAAAIVAAWFYTGGKNPYGYAALGEVSVFIFFGLVATIGTEYIQTGDFSANSIFGGVAMGAISSAVLMVNNIRDIDLDRHVGKKTLAVRVGKSWAKAIYLILLWAPIAILIPFPFLYPASVFAYSSVLLIAPATLIVLTAKTPKELILVLKLTSFAGLVYGALLGYGLAAVSI